MDETAREPVLVDLALQGGGSHGAFTWGVLDRLSHRHCVSTDRQVLRANTDVTAIKDVSGDLLQRVTPDVIHGSAGACLAELTCD
jgi:predicted acylesterase/phospholipase RssA